ncbi:hypothetical protein [Bifidobacterium callitrichidarum]|uniref:Uncharacterized protein n=1 Tax=Bifidobacterium callitrichidarum TaxID=2052941 RepID=A0A2U2N0R1_9BIFI|nr:hypothetical protein [Bifidobacterium callitrichidarum]PWG62643.1 hypothetical protein DF196_11840 [Bifidobacterium callitrichidarum]
MINNQPLFKLEELEDSVLYDLFYEAGTILGGKLFKLRQEAKAAGNLQLAEDYRNEAREMRRIRESIASNDRESQIRYKNQWDKRAQELREQRP